MKLALVNDTGLVVRTVEHDNPAAVMGKASLAKHVECPAEVEKGWHYDGTTFTPPTAEEQAANAKALEDADRRTRFLDIMDKLMDTLEGKDILTIEEIATIWEAGR